MVESKWVEKHRNIDRGDYMNATETAIDLTIRTGLFLAPRRVLLDMSADLKRQSQRISRVSTTEEVERKAA